jgi:BirA family transcriptional regulator, biotin operon repressor / biotin---[acetyl-CoA-carboxylase] ligase
MYKFLANTVFLGKDIVYLTECHSTNDLAKLKIKNKEVAEGSIIITENQSAGRGQRGNAWISEPGKNLTFSLVLQPEFIEPNHQFNLNIAISLAIQEVLQNYANDIQIKWPNDIVHPKMGKLGGILIESFIGKMGLEYVVVGVGLNVNQTAFPLEGPTSLANLAHQEFDLWEIFKLIVQSIESKYIQLKRKGVQELKKQYLSNLFQFEEWKKYEDEEVFLGQILGIDEFGRLRIQTSDGDEKCYSFKEVKFL